MPLTRDEVKNLADLARLDLSEQELVNAERELEAVLGYVDRLGKIDTTDVEAQSMPARAEGWRDDVSFTCDEATREVLLANFPSRTRDLLSVPAVFQNPKV